MQKIFQKNFYQDDCIYVNTASNTLTNTVLELIRRDTNEKSELSVYEWSLTPGPHTVWTRSLTSCRKEEGNAVRLSRAFATRAAVQYLG